LADSWRLEQGGASLTVSLKTGVRFSDGSPMDAATVASVLPDALRANFGPIADDVDSIEAHGAAEIRIQFRRPSLLHLEALEAGITKPGKPVIGTGAYTTAVDANTELRANQDYYLGRPTIQRIVVSTYPSVRAAWAEALRGNLDMLYEVS